MLKLKKRQLYQMIAKTLVCASVITMLPSVNLVTWAAADSNTLMNQYFNVKIGDYGEINSLKLTGDEFDTNYVLNGTNAPTQGASSEHQWMGELMFQTKKDGDSNWTESMTSASSKSSGARTITKNGNKITVTYKNESANKGIKDFELEETYELIDSHLKWSMKVTNPDSNKSLTFGDFGLPMTFNEYFTAQYGGELLYETRVIDHSFVGQDSSYIYATRPSGQGRFLLFEPDVATGAKLEYQDHWRENNGHRGSVWAQDTGGWANGLNVFYIHSNVIKQTGSSYLPNTELTLKPGESKEYSFNFTPVQNEKAMRSELYNSGIIDAVAVPGMAFSKDMPAKFYLHTKYGYNTGNANNNITDVEVKCSHETHLYEGLENSISNKQQCTKSEGTNVSFEETKTIDGEQYHVFNLKLTDLGANYVLIHYLDDSGKEKVTTLQFYSMDKAEDALDLHANFVTNKTQVNAPGKIEDMIFDDWMMDTKNVRGIYNGYMGWGDDWGFTHGEYLAEKNVYLPEKKQIDAVDNYLDTAIWNGLMREHHEDYRVNDWLDNEPNNTGQGVYRGYAYPHVYNTYFSMYKVASKYPDMTTYKEKKETYLLRAYNILKALYGKDIAYNWDTGLMGESTTPDIIAALEKEGFYKEAQNIRDIMAEKYVKFSEQKYPYGSEYSYDNTGEEAVYTLAKLKNNQEMMKKIDEKTRAARGMQPVWYHYANPTTICGENWWNFQYSASLIGYCMDDWLRLQNNGMDAMQMALAARTNYAAKLANLTAINSGQIDADPANIGTVAWTYQAELGNNGGQGNGGGKIHNGWRQMAGEADTGLFGAMRILSSDVATDPVFGLFGYGCSVTDEGDSYNVMPLDGLYTRLNFINEKLSIKLDRDQYSNAIVSKNSDSVKLMMKNVERTDHNTDIELTGLKAGSYQVSIGGNVVGSFKTDGKTVTTTIPMPASDNVEVLIEAGSTLSNTEPVVEAGEDKTIQLSEKIRLEGSASDDKQPNTTLTSNWTVESAPSDAVPEIKNSNQLISDIKFNKTGEYVFRLTASDGELEGSDTVKITVVEDAEIPETLALYNFDNVNMDKTNREAYRKLLSADGEGKGYASERISNPVFETGKEGQALSLSGSYCGYVRLPADITKRVDETTISADIKLSASQGSDARIFEFRDMEGKSVYASVINGNELAMGITDAVTKENKQVSSNIKIGTGYWKNVSITIGMNLETNVNTAILYVDGVKAGEIPNCIKLSDLDDIQRNFIGRGDNKAGVFFNGLIDNFTVKSKAMTSDEISVAYGSTEGSAPVSAEISNIVTKVGESPVLPKQVRVLYSNGIYKVENVIWDSIDSENYAKVGTFIVEGKVEDVTEKAKLTVHVVNGDAQNIASIATSSAIINSVDDLGGVKGLNDGYDPENSTDTSHGVWHNWHGDQGGSAWIEYDWEKPVVLTESDAYYFKDGGGNFMPASVDYEYKSEDGIWKKFDNVVGLGLVKDNYNKTTFSPVVATAIRMNMKPATVGCGVIEWQVYGYSNEEIVSKKALKQAINNANGIKEKLIESGYSDLTDALTEANQVLSDSEASQEAIDEATEKISEAIDNLVPKDNNIAYLASTATSYVSPWETLGAVNDGIESTDSSAANIPHYGSWGNNSEYETVTYTWLNAKDIRSTEIYFWNDGGGILTPSVCKYEYQDDNGNWVEVSNPDGLGVELDRYNVTNFDKIITKALRVTMTKSVADGNGVGIIEWKVTGNKAEQTVNKGELEKLYDAHKNDTQGDYKDEEWSEFIKALENAKEVIDNEAATQIEVDNARDALKSAIDRLDGDTEPDLINIAEMSTTTPSAVINSVDDLGGVDGLNDGYDPENSSDTSHGVWHNWHGDQSGPAWIEYNWDELYIIKESDAYYFKDGSGNFVPASIKYEYRDEDGEWREFKNVEGLGVELDKYNKTTFNPVKAKGIRMTLVPLTLGCGVIEWKVYGYLAEDVPDDGVDKSALEELYNRHKDDTQGDYKDEDWNAFVEALNDAKEVIDNSDATQDEVDNAKDKLRLALEKLKGNIPDGEVDKTGLQELYDVHKEDTQGRYTIESWSNFVNALDNALKVLGDVNATQVEVNDAKASLRLAIDGLRAVDEPVEVVDKSGLQELYDAHKNDKKGRYTAKSWENFIEELKHAMMVLENTNSTQREVEDAEAALKLAIDNRKRKSRSSSSSSSSSENSTSTSKNISQNNNSIVKLDGVAQNIADDTVDGMKAKVNSSEILKTQNGGSALFTNANIGDNKVQIITTNVTDTIEINKETNMDSYVYIYVKELNAYMPTSFQILNGNIVFKAEPNIPYVISQNVISGTIIQGGWNKINESWYFVKNDGKPVTGWYNDNGTWYNMSKDGKMNIKWFKDADGTWYYLKDSGVMTTGWFEDTDGKWYYFKENGSMAQNESINGHFLDNNGVWIK